MGAGQGADRCFAMFLQGMGNGCLGPFQHAGQRVSLTVNQGLLQAVFV